MSTPLPEDVRLAMSAGQKIEAIRLLRERTGLGLADAKAAVESGRLPAAASPSAQAEALPLEVQAALVSGNRIEAIRLLREAEGGGLKEAKDRIDAFERGAGGRGAAGRAPGGAPRRGLDVRLLVVVAAIVAAVAWLLLSRG
jgi:ribosomal protein L7/L12